MKPKRRPLTKLPDCRDPQGLVDRARRYLEDQRVNNYAEATIASREEHLSGLIRWCHDRELSRPEQVDRALLERYKRHLFHYRKRNGKPLSVTSQVHQLTTLRVFFKWLAKKAYLSYNPACELELPRQPAQLPRNILTAKEVEKILSLPDLRSPYGIRDRAILEVLYSTAIRRKEIVGLDLNDVHRERGLLHIRMGKGGRERFVPIGSRALKWLEKYLDDVRSFIINDYKDEALFITQAKGLRFKAPNLGVLVRDYIERAEINKSGGCHIFRHTAATLMLENGADIRSLQELLGHAKLNTTQIYTKVSLTMLRAVHEKTHPAQRQEKRRREKHAKREPPDRSDA